MDILQTAKENTSFFEMNPPALFTVLKARNSEFVPNIVSIARQVEAFLDMIPAVFPGGIFHNVFHSIRVIDYMCGLVLEVEKLNDLEITVLIALGLLHDIGMFASKEDITAIRNSTYELTNISFKALLHQMGGDEDRAVRYVLKKTHAKRSAKLIRENFAADLYVPSGLALTFSEDVALICESHHESYEWMEKNLANYRELMREKQRDKGVYSFSPTLCAAILRIANLLDFDSRRIPPELSRLTNPRGFSIQAWRKHVSIDNREKVKTDRLNHKELVVSGSCDNVTIYRKLLDYLKGINEEINAFNQFMEKMPEKYCIHLKYPVTNNIEVRGFEPLALQLNVNYYAIINLLVGEKIYGDKRYGLREIIQNSIDACKVRAEVETRPTETRPGGVKVTEPGAGGRAGENKPGERRPGSATYPGTLVTSRGLKGKRTGLEDGYKPAIKIILDRGKNRVTIEDNGIGMTLETIKKYFLSIGNSYYQSDEFILQGFHYKPIGTFGIGFLSCFMLSEEVRVETSARGERDKHIISLSRASRHVGLLTVEDQEFTGTRIILNYTQFLQAFNNDVHNVSSFISTHFITDNIELALLDLDAEESNTLTNGSLLASSAKPESPLEQKNVHNIDIAQFLENIEGCMEIALAENLSDLLAAKVSDFFTGDCYYFDGQNLLKVEPLEFDWKRVYVEQKRQVRTLEIIPLNNDAKFQYSLIIERTNDPLAAWKNLREQLGREIGKQEGKVTILLDQGLAMNLPEKPMYVKGALEVLADSMRLLKEGETGVTEYVPTLRTQHVQAILPGQGSSYLQVAVYNLALDVETGRCIELSKENTGTQVDSEIYLKSILVDNDRFLPEYITPLVEFQRVRVNILRSEIEGKNRIKFETDISRTKLEDGARQILHAALTLTPYLWLLEQDKLTEEEKKSINVLLRQCFDVGNELFHKKHIDLHQHILRTSVQPNL